MVCYTGVSSNVVFVVVLKTELATSGTLGKYSIDRATSLVIPYLILIP